MHPHSHMQICLHRFMYQLSDSCIILYALDIHTLYRTDSFCSRFCQLLIPSLPTPTPQFCMGGVKLGLERMRALGCLHHPWVFWFRREVSARKGRQKQPFQRKQPWGPESREYEAESLQFYILGRFTALLNSVRCLLALVSLCFSLFQSLSFPLSLSPDLSTFGTLTNRKGGKVYVRDNYY